MNRWDIPVDGETHPVRALTIRGTFVTCRPEVDDVVELWAEASGPEYPQMFYRVYVDDEEVPAGIEYVGSTVVTQSQAEPFMGLGQFSPRRRVYHLFLTDGDL